MKPINFRIKTKRDWGIAAIFACLLSFVLAEPLWNLVSYPFGKYSLRDFMMNFFPDKMTYVNYPATYGLSFVTVILMTILVTVTLGLSGKSLKRCLLSVLTGILLCAAILAAFHIHCSLIVGSAKGADNFSFRLYSHDTGYDNYKGELSNTNAANETAVQITELCRELVPVPSAEQKMLQQAYTDRLPDRLPEVKIWITYPEKYGHTFWLLVNVSEEYIYINSTDNPRELIFYRDNGLKQSVMDIMHPSDQ